MEIEELSAIGCFLERQIYYRYKTALQLLTEGHLEGKLK